MDESLLKIGAVLLMLIILFSVICSYTTSFLDLSNSIMVMVTLKRKSPSLKLFITQFVLFSGASAVLVLVFINLSNVNYHYLLILLLLIKIIQRHIRLSSKEVINPLLYRLKRNKSIKNEKNDKNNSVIFSVNTVLLKTGSFLRKFIQGFLISSLILTVILVYSEFPFEDTTGENILIYALFVISISLPATLFFTILNISIIKKIRFDNDIIRINYFFRSRSSVIDLRELRQAVVKHSRYCEFLYLDIKDRYHYIKLKDVNFDKQDWGRLKFFFEERGLLMGKKEWLDELLF
ncbi:MAG: hypothetical protein GY754_25180 [bacterium]|nr:hypothetical protein [bacterium]